MDIDYWYLKLKNKYGFDFIIDAGYFEEDKQFNFNYSYKYSLPKNTTIIQFSGAFYPFHDGHYQNVIDAINLINEENGVVIIHADHNSYRETKGEFDYDSVKRSLDFSDKSLPNNWQFLLVDENEFNDNCSRNFTRLYFELLNFNNRVYFLCGGDRANFALTFKDDGYCIVVGRSDHDNFNFYKEELKNKSNIIFLDRIDYFSSSKIRNNKFKINN